MAKKELTAKELKEKLFMKKKNAVLRMTDEELKKCDLFCEGYEQFLDKGKTEREAAAFIEAAARAKGFVPFDKKKTYKANAPLLVSMCRTTFLSVKCLISEESSQKNFLLLKILRNWSGV